VLLVSECPNIVVVQSGIVVSEIYQTLKKGFNSYVYNRVIYDLRSTSLVV